MKFLPKAEFHGYVKHLKIEGLQKVVLSELPLQYCKEPYYDTFNGF